MKNATNKIIALLAALVIINIANAQWSTDPSANNDIYTTGGNYSLGQVPDGVGGAIFVWEHQGSNFRKIYAQHFDTDGKKLWGNFLVVCNASVAQSNPSVTSDGSGGAIISWQDYRNGTEDIYAQKITSSGQTAWAANGVPICTAVKDQMNVTSCEDGIGGAYLTWVDYRSGIGTANIYVQKIDENGNMQWDANGKIVCNLTTGQFYPKVIAGNNSAIVSWIDYRDVPGKSAVFAQKIGNDGLDKWVINGKRISESTVTNILEANIIYDNSGGIYTSYSTNAKTIKIHVRRFDENGDPIGNTTIIGDVNYDCSAPTLAADATGGVVVTWQDGRNFSSNGYDIYAMRIGRNNKVKWNAAEVAVIPGTQANPKIISDNVGGTIITWEDGEDIYAQRLDTNGSIKWSLGGNAVTTALKKQIIATIISDEASGAIISWYDGRFSGSDLFCQKVYQDGKFTAAINNTVKNKIKIFPNPASTQLTIEFKNNIEVGSTVKLIDCYGRNVLTNEFTQSQSILNIENLSTGFYTLQILTNAAIETYKIEIIR